MGKLLPSLRLFAFFLLLGTVSCVESVENQVQIYDNNFSKLDLANFENGRLLIWRNDTIAGWYNNEEVAVLVFPPIAFTNPFPTIFLDKITPKQELLKPICQAYAFLEEQKTTPLATV